MDQEVSRLMYLLLGAANRILHDSETLGISIKDAYNKWKDEGVDLVEQDHEVGHQTKKLLKEVQKIIPELCEYKTSSEIPSNAVLERWEDLLGYFVLIRDAEYEFRQDFKLN